MTGNPLGESYWMCLSPCCRLLPVRDWPLLQQRDCRSENSLRSRILWRGIFWFTLHLQLRSQTIRTEDLEAGRSFRVVPNRGKDPLEKEMATHSDILAWKNPMDWGVRQATVHRQDWSDLALTGGTSNTGREGSCKHEGRGNFQWRTS